VKVQRIDFLPFYPALLYLYFSIKVWHIKPCWLSNVSCRPCSQILPVRKRKHDRPCLTALDDEHNQVCGHLKRMQVPDVNYARFRYPEQKLLHPVITTLGLATIMRAMAILALTTESLIPKRPHKYPTLTSSLNRIFNAHSQCIP